MPLKYGRATTKTQACCKTKHKHVIKSLNQTKACFNELKPNRNVL